MTGRDPQTSFVQAAGPEKAVMRTDLDELRKTWGTDADAGRGLSAAMGVASQARS